MHIVNAFYNNQLAKGYKISDYGKRLNEIDFFIGSPLSLR